MTVKHNYQCAACKHDYTETRAADESAFFTKCVVCGADYVEVSSEVISETVERAPGIDPVEEVTE